MRNLFKDTFFIIGLIMVVLVLIPCIIFHSMYIFWPIAGVLTFSTFIAKITYIPDEEHNDSYFGIHTYKEPCCKYCTTPLIKSSNYQNCINCGAPIKWKYTGYTFVDDPDFEFE